MEANPLSIWDVALLFCWTRFGENVSISVESFVGFKMHSYELTPICTWILCIVIQNKQCCSFPPIICCLC